MSKETKSKGGNLDARDLEQRITVDLKPRTSGMPSLTSETTEQCSDHATGPESLVIEVPAAIRKGAARCVGSHAPPLDTNR